MRLSLSMIVKNEERFLPGCLESVRDLVDEIVIVDTGSTDRTKEIARGFGARVFDFRWQDDFSLARNESLKLTRGDWVLYLDADERIEELFHDRIRKLISGGNADAFLLNLKSKIGTEGVPQYHLVSYPRLFRKMKGIRFEGKVHEQINNSLIAACARIVQTDVVVVHLGYAQDAEVIRDKAQRNYRLLVSQIERRENYGYALYQLGQTEIVLGETERGIEHLYEALAAGGFGKPVEASIFDLIAENKFKLGDFDAALTACEKSLDAAPLQSFALIMKGEIFLKAGNYTESVKVFIEALARYRSYVLEGKSATAIEPIFDLDFLYSRIGVAASLSGDRQTARTFLARAAGESEKAENVMRYFEFLSKAEMHRELIEESEKFKAYKDEDWYLRFVASAEIEIGNFLEAAGLLAKISAHDPGTLSSLANCRVKTGDFEGAEQAFRRAFDLGYHDTQSLELFGLTQFKLGKFSEAVETLTKVAEAEPENIRSRKFIQAAKAFADSR